MQAVVKRHFIGQTDQFLFIRPGGHNRAGVLADIVSPFFMVFCQTFFGFVRAHFAACRPQNQNAFALDFINRSQGVERRLNGAAFNIQKLFLNAVDFIR